VRRRQLKKCLLVTPAEHWPNVDSGISMKQSGACGASRAQPGLAQQGLWPRGRAGRQAGPSEAPRSRGLGCRAGSRTAWTQHQHEAAR
jgi:hypothetical protein